MAPTEGMRRYSGFVEHVLEQASALLELEDASTSKLAPPLSAIQTTAASNPGQAVLDFRFAQGCDNDHYLRSACATLAVAVSESRAEGNGRYGAADELYGARSMQQVRDGVIAAMQAARDSNVEKARATLRTVAAHLLPLFQLRDLAQDASPGQELLQAIADNRVEFESDDVATRDQTRELLRGVRQALANFRRAVDDSEGGVASLFLKLVENQQQVAAARLTQEREAAEARLAQERDAAQAKLAQLQADFERAEAALVSEIAAALRSQGATLPSEPLDPVLGARVDSGAVYRFVPAFREALIRAARATGRQLMQTSRLAWSAVLFSMSIVGASMVATEELDRAMDGMAQATLAFLFNHCRLGWQWVMVIRNKAALRGLQVKTVNVAPDFFETPTKDDFILERDMSYVLFDVPAGEPVVEELIKSLGRRKVLSPAKQDTSGGAGNPPPLYRVTLTYNDRGLLVHRATPELAQMLRDSETNRARVFGRLNYLAALDPAKGTAQWEFDDRTGLLIRTLPPPLAEAVRAQRSLGDRLAELRQGATAAVFGDAPTDFLLAAFAARARLLWQTYDPAQGDATRVPLLRGGTRFNYSGTTDSLVNLLNDTQAAAAAGIETEYMPGFPTMTQGGVETVPPPQTFSTTWKDNVGDVAPWVVTNMSSGVQLTYANRNWDRVLPRDRPQLAEAVATYPLCPADGTIWQLNDTIVTTEVLQNPPPQVALLQNVQPGIAPPANQVTAAEAGVPVRDLCYNMPDISALRKARRQFAAVVGGAPSPPAAMPTTSTTATERLALAGALDAIEHDLALKPLRSTRKIDALAHVGSRCAALAASADADEARVLRCAAAALKLHQVERLAQTLPPKRDVTSTTAAARNVRRRVHTHPAVLQAFTRHEHPTGNGTDDDDPLREPPGLEGQDGNPAVAPDTATEAAAAATDAFSVQGLRQMLDEGQQACNELLIEPDEFAALLAQQRSAPDRPGAVTASERRAALWDEVLRHIAVSSDRMFVFLRHLAGLIGEDVDTLIVRDEKAEAAKEAQIQEELAVVKRISETHAKILETVLSGLASRSTLSIGRNQEGDLVVIDTKAREQLQELARGEGGKTFFNARRAQQGIA